MADLRNRLSRFTFAFVFFPLFLLLTIINNQIYGNLNRAQNLRSDRVLEGVVAEVEQSLEKEWSVLEEHARDAEVARILELTRRPAGEGQAGWTVEKWFEEVVKMERGAVRISDEDAARRAAQYNPLSKKFNALCEAEPAIVNVMVSDILGDVIAASYPPEETNVKNSPGWRRAIRQRSGDFTTEGPDENQRLWINVPVWQAREENLPLGVMRFEMDLKEMVANIKMDSLTDNQAVMVVGNKAWFGLGTRDMLNRAGEKIYAYVNKNYLDKGYHAGMRFNRRFLDEKHGFEPNLRVLVLMQEPLIVGPAMAKLGISSFLSLALLAGITLLAHRTGRAIASQQEEVEGAGQVLLSRIRQPSDTALEKGTTGKRSTMRHLDQELNGWLARYRQSVLDNVASHEFEMQRDLELAKEFQMAYLNRPYPKVPRVHVAGRMRLKFAHRYSPALVLGGDFFDVVSLEHDCVGVYVADVMGHGTRSALITSILRTLIAELASAKGRNARSFMAEINRGFCELLNSVKMPHPLFASAYYFVADTTARAATYCTAGHPAPYHLKRKANTLERLAVTAPHGSALGINPKEEYTGGACRLNPGDAFVFFTDGVYEAFNANGEEFGLLNIERVIRAKMHTGIDAILDGIIEAVDLFTGHEPLRDDICLVGIEVTEEAE